MSDRFTNTVGVGVLVSDLRGLSLDLRALGSPMIRILRQFPPFVQ